MAIDQFVPSGRLGSIRAVDLSVGIKLVLLSILFSHPSFGQVPTYPNEAAGSCTELKPGVVVESVGKNSEAEKAGLAEGDVILSWNRGELNGEIRSPFDLAEAEIEQGPRSQVGLRGHAQQPRFGPGRWGRENGELACAPP
jgi:S1-C subfamily serine protease